MQIGVHHRGIGAVFLAQRDFFLRIGKLLQAAFRVFVGGTVVSLHQIGDGHRLGTIVLTNPVGIRQVDAYRGRRKTIAAKGGDDDAFGRNAATFLFLETRVDRRMVLKPLGVFADGVGAFGSLQVLEIHHTLPCGLHTHRVAVVLDETVHEVDMRGIVLHPSDVIGVPSLEVASLIIFDKFLSIITLGIVFGHLVGLFEPTDDGFDGLAIKSVGTVHLFIN